MKLLVLALYRPPPAVAAEFTHDYLEDEMILYHSYLQRVVEQAGASKGVEWAVVRNNEL